MSDERPIFYDTYRAGAVLMLVCTSDDPGVVEAGRVREVSSIAKALDFSHRQILVDLDQLAGDGRLAGSLAINRIDRLYDVDPAFHTIAQLFYRRGFEAGIARALESPI